MKKSIAIINIVAISTAALIGAAGVDAPGLLSAVGLVMIIAGIWTSIIVIKQN